jgi:hypothetical protein
MVGDLGKATALKQAGIWEIDAWTFLSNYPIPEEIGARIVALGHEAGIDVSWRGADYLADGLQMHRSIRERFPALQVSEITERLGELHDAIRDPDGDPFYSIPETPAQQRRLIAGRPPGWEYLLFAGVILQGRQAMEIKWHDHRLKIATSRARLTHEDALAYIADAMSPLLASIGSMMPAFAADSQELASGVPGESGDPGAIEHFARRIVTGYEEMLDWAAEVRGVEAPAVFNRVFELIAKVADRPIDQLRAFFEEITRETVQLPEYLAKPDSDQEVLVIKVGLALEVDEELMSELSREIDRAGDNLVIQAGGKPPRRRRRWGSDRSDD